MIHGLHSRRSVAKTTIATLIIIDPLDSIIDPLDSITDPLDSVTDPSDSRAKGHLEGGSGISPSVARRTSHVAPWGLGTTSCGGLVWEGKSSRDLLAMEEYTRDQVGRAFFSPPSGVSRGCRLVEAHGREGACVVSNHRPWATVDLAGTTMDGKGGGTSAGAVRCVQVDTCSTTGLGSIASRWGVDAKCSSKKYSRPEEG